MSAPHKLEANRPVLLVEDDPVYRNSMAGLLRGAGHEVLTAKDGTEALELLSNDLLLTPWVVVTDLVMPGKDGEQLIQSLRASASWRKIPVVVITGVAAADRTEISAEVLLVKPVTHQQLHDVLCAMAPRYGQIPPRAISYG